LYSGFENYEIGESAALKPWKYSFSFEMDAQTYFYLEKDIIYEVIPLGN
jgi:hypothetical protein